MLRILSIVFCLCSFVAAQTGTDKATLKNGDTITGTVLASQGEAIIFESASFGEVKIKFADIASLITNSVVEFKTADGKRVKSRVMGFDAGTLKLDGSAGTLHIDQIDMINPPAEGKPVWTGAIDAGGHFSDGNTNKRGAKVNAAAQRRGEDDRVSFKASWNYSEEKLTGTTGWTLSERNASAGAQYDYFFTEKMYGLANTGVETDTFADTHIRYTAGLGLGYQWVEDDCLKFSTEVGANYINREFFTTQPLEEYVAARLAYKLGWNITDDLVFLQDVNALPSLEDKEQVIVKADSRLRYTLTSNLYTQLQWEMDYENQPSPGFDRVDNRYFWTFGWSF